MSKSAFPQYWGMRNNFCYFKTTIEIRLPRNRTDATNTSILYQKCCGYKIVDKISRASWWLVISFDFSFSAVGDNLGTAEGRVGCIEFCHILYYSPQCPKCLQLLNTQAYVNQETLADSSLESSESDPFTILSSESMLPASGIVCTRSFSASSSATPNISLTVKELSLEQNSGSSER